MASAAANNNNKILEAMLPDEEEEDLPQPDVKCEVRDSDSALFTWKIYYAMALANLVEIHLETLNKRRVALVK